MSRENVTPASIRYENEQNPNKTPSFKFTGLIVLAIVSILLIGFSPHDGAGQSGPIEQFIAGLGQAINNITDAISGTL